MLHHALFQFYETKARRQRRATAPGNRFEAGDVPVDAGRFSVWCETLAPKTSVDSQEASRAIPHPLDAQRFLASVEDLNTVTLPLHCCLVSKLPLN